MPVKLPSRGVLTVADIRNVSEFGLRPQLCASLFLVFSVNERPQYGTFDAPYAIAYSYRRELAGLNEFGDFAGMNAEHERDIRDGEESAKFTRHALIMCRRPGPLFPTRAMWISQPEGVSRPHNERLQTEGFIVARTHLGSRFRRIDLRLILGLLLMAASVAGVIGYVSLFDRTTPVYVARAAIPSGTELRSDDLRVEQMNLAEAEALYLVPADPMEHLVASRPIAPGELLAKSAVSSSPLTDSITTVVSVSGPLPSSVSIGRTVDVWASADGSVRGEEVPPPYSVVTGAEVIHIDEPAGFGASDAHSVEIRVPKVKLAALLAASSRGLAFTLVSVGSTP